MSSSKADVVIVGGGIAGLSAAYYLGQAGVKSVVVERDAVGSHTSGFAYGGVGSLGGPGPTLAVAELGVSLHRELWKTLPEQTGVNMDYRSRPSLALAFTEEEVQALKIDLEWKQQQTGYDVRRVDRNEAMSIEPLASPEILGGVYAEGRIDVEPYRLAVALARASEALGASVRTGRVTGLKRENGRVTAVILEEAELSCDHAVLAMGPWSEEASDWLGIPIRVRPLKGQILRLRSHGPPFRTSVGWGFNYATTKPDGLVWAGTTQEEAGFDDRPTAAGREQIMTSLLKMAPSLADAELVLQTACLRPLSNDGLVLVGKVPGWDGVYMATGAGGSGIALGPALGKIAADLITSGFSPIPLDAFDPARFARRAAGSQQDPAPDPRWHTVA